MYAIYRKREDTLIFHKGYWTTAAAAQAVCDEKPQRHQLEVRPLQLLADHVEVAGGRIVRSSRNTVVRAMYDVSARVVGEDRRQCMGWYATLVAAMKKRRKHNTDVSYDDWVIERSEMDDTMWADNVASDTESL